MQVKILISAWIVYLILKLCLVLLHPNLHRVQLSPQIANTNLLMHLYSLKPQPELIYLSEDLNTILPILLGLDGVLSKRFLDTIQLHKEVIQC
jgi:hypothetical protein